MAYYLVTARFDFARAREFHRDLIDGTIARQKPDGREIAASMHRARIGTDGLVRWSEKCFCDPPLSHERATVYDRFFIDMRVEPIEGHREVPGERFMQRLRRYDQVTLDDEVAYACDWCGTEAGVAVDPSAGTTQEFVEDCPACCRPNVIHVEIDEDGNARASATMESI